MTSLTEHAVELSGAMRLLADLFTEMPELPRQMQTEGLGHHHARILHAIVTDGELTMSEIARKIKLSDSSATILVDQLVKKKLALRIRPPEDRRVVRVGVTRSGKKLADELAQLFIVLAGQILETLDEKERERYMQLTLKIVDTLKQTPHSRAER